MDKEVERQMAIEAMAEVESTQVVGKSSEGNSKKPYEKPVLRYEGQWDTVTMQFGGSVGGDGAGGNNQGAPREGFNLWKWMTGRSG